MPMRRTIGISLAFLVISAGAIAKTPDKSSSHNPGQFHNLKSGKAEARNRRTRIASCQAAHARSDRRIADRRRGQGWDRRDSSPSADDASGGPPDAYIGPMHPVGRSQAGTAAWYNQVGGQTASGEILDTVTPTAAHRSLPLASYAKVTSLDSGRSVVVKINDRGPWSRRFIIDLSPRAADELDVKRTGVAAVVVEPVAAGPAQREEAPTVAAVQTSAAPAAQ
jgi:rare lipoprotein A (peptidoglycan hydrolase)